MRALYVLISMSIVFCGCAASTAALQTESSGAIGCAPDAIAISDYKLDVTTSSWVATCGDKKYFCSASDTLKGSKCAAAVTQ